MTMCFLSDIVGADRGVAQETHPPATVAALQVPHAESIRGLPQLTSIATVAIEAGRGPQHRQGRRRPETPWCHGRPEGSCGRCTASGEYIESVTHLCMTRDQHEHEPQAWPVSVQMSNAATEVLPRTRLRGGQANGCGDAKARSAACCGPQGGRYCRACSIQPASLLIQRGLLPGRLAPKFMKRTRPNPQARSLLYNSGFE